MNDIQRMMYQSLVSIRNNEVNLRWTRNQLFFLVNSAAITLVVTQLKVTDTFFGFACFIGLSVSLLWIMVLHRIRRWVSYWESCLEALETLDGNPIQIFKGGGWETVRMGYTTHRILVVLSLIFILVWLVLLVSYALSYIF